MNICVILFGLKIWYNYTVLAAQGLNLPPPSIILIMEPWLVKFVLPVQIYEM